MTDATQVQTALRRAAGRTSAVRWAGLSAGGFATYHVGSSNDVDRAYRVTVDREGTYRCCCPSELRPACWHRASVFLVRVQREAGGLPADGPRIGDSARRLEEIAAQFA